VGSPAPAPSASGAGPSLRRVVIDDSYMRAD